MTTKEIRDAMTKEIEAKGKSYERLMQEWKHWEDEGNDCNAQLAYQVAQVKLSERCALIDLFEKLNQRGAF